MGEAFDEGAPDPAPAAQSERGRQRREAILKAATAEFMQKGYQGASLRNIIRASGGSAETLYRMFGNKEGLFQAVNTAPRERFKQLLVGEKSSQPVDEALIDIARAFLQIIVEEESLAIVRMMIGESGAMPEVSRTMWDLGPAGFHVKMAGYLKRQADAGVLHIPDPELAARQFIGLVRAGLDQKILCGVVKATPEIIEQQARSGVAIFLKGTEAKPS